MAIVQQVRRFEPSFENRNVDHTRAETSLHSNVETSINTDAPPPSYSDVSQSSEQLPPPYPGV